jgi:photosynthetic reaction center cytochrome c subunit
MAFDAFAQLRKNPAAAPKNLQILQPSEVQSQMNAYRTGLAMPCSYCHMPGGDFASDDNPNKLITRQMVLLTREINAKLGEGQVHVTCFTCHRGAEKPLLVP